MECEVKRRRESSSSHTAEILEEQVKTATDKLLLTNFSGCLEICRHVVTAAKDCEDADHETRERLEKVQEASTVLGIQALAEQGAWRDVIPFVEQVYTHMAACPPTIMQMCLLLHAQVREYMVCHTLFNTWVEWDDHQNHPECAAIVKLYVSHVLVPLGAFNLVPQVVERCSTLSSEERQALLSPQIATPSSPPPPPPSLHLPALGTGESLSDPSLDEYSLPDTDAHDTEETTEDKSPSGYRIITLYLQLARRLFRSLAKKGWCRQIRRFTKVFFLVSFIILAIVQVQTDVTANFSRAIEIWKTAIRSLSGMLSRQHIKEA